MNSNPRTVQCEIGQHTLKVFNCPISDSPEQNGHICPISPSIDNRSIRNPHRYANAMPAYKAKASYASKNRTQTQTHAQNEKRKYYQGKTNFLLKYMSKL